MCKHKKYEFENKRSETGDSIYALPIPEEGESYYHLDAIKSAIRDLVSEELDKRLGPFRKNKEDDNIV